MVSSSIRLTAWLPKFKEAGGTIRRLMYEQSHRDYLRSGYPASSSACHGLLIITVITPLPTKPSATKMPENWSWRTWITDMQMRQRDVAALDAKYTKELADAKSWKWCSAWWCCRWSSSVTHIKAVCQSVREATTASAWIMQPPPDWQTPLNGIISPSERGWSLCKNNWKEPRSILMSSADTLPFIRGQLSLYCEQYTRASSINA